MTDAPTVVMGGIHHAPQLEGKRKHVKARTEVG
jgi:hypothetical protein